MTSFDSVHPRGGNPANTGQFSERTRQDPGQVLHVAAGPLTDADKQEG